MTIDSLPEVKIGGVVDRSYTVGAVSVFVLRFPLSGPHRILPVAESPVVVLESTVVRSDSGSHDARSFMSSD